MHASYDWDYDSTENQGLDKTSGNNRLHIFSYSLWLLLLLLFITGFPNTTRHQKAKCQKLFPEEDLPVWGHRAVRFPGGAGSCLLPGRQCAGAGDQASPDWSQLNFMQFFSFPVLPNTEPNGKEVCFIAQQLLHCCWSPQLSNTWMFKLSTNSWKEQVFPADKFAFKCQQIQNPQE